nr:MAG TPA: transposase [Caudoviricetes sp.]
MKNKDKAIQMLRDNIPIGKIVEATGYSRGYLYKLGSGNGIVRERVSINDYKEQILYMIVQGKTFSEIGQAIGYSEITVHNCINAWKRAEKRKDEPEERNAEQEGIEEIAFPEKQLSFVERKTFRPPIVDYEGKKWQDVTELCCPR